MSEKENNKAKKYKNKAKEFLRKVKECRKEKDEYLNELKRSRADLINYKRAELSRMDDYLKKEKERIFLEIISILDNFKYAAKQAEKMERKDSLTEGFLQIKEQIKNFLKEQGVKKIKTEEEDFDPHYHEAVEVEESEKESGKIIKELQEGYTFKDKVIRPSRVKVAK